MLTYDEKKFFAPKPETAPFCPPRCNPVTLPEKVEHTARELRDTLDRLMMFEKNITDKYEDLMAVMTQDNVTFKNLMQDAWSDFVSTVRSEINLFETNTDSVVALFKQAVNTRLSEHMELYEAYKAELETIVAEYEQGIREEVDTISAKVDEAYRYMKTNINESLSEVLHDMEESGALVGIVDSDVLITPKYFGAVGDGVTDDSDAIQQAIDSGKPVYFSAGTYLTTKPLEFIGLDNINFNSANATIKYTGDSCAIIMRNVTDSQFTFGNIYAPNGSGIQFDGITATEYSQYISVDFISIIAKYFGVIAAIEGGWVNEVHFFKGRISAETAVKVYTASTDECTGWKFNEVSIEGSKLGFLFEGNNSRFGSFEINGTRYGDDNSATVLKIDGTMRMLYFKSSQPFYPHYLDATNATIYNSVMEAPFTDASGNVRYFKRIYNTVGKYCEVGFITREQQELFMDFASGSFAKHGNVNISSNRCQKNGFLVNYYSHVAVNDVIGAWSTILTVPENCRVKSNGSCKVYIPSRNVWVLLYVNADGTVTNETALSSGDEFDFQYTAIENGNYNL